jgi:hypothetical protein
MKIATPDWLTKRGGALRQNYDGDSWTVVFDERPQYSIQPVPADGRHACEVVQLNNGMRISDANRYDSAEGAIAGGLDRLRANLGW